MKKFNSLLHDEEYLKYLSRNNLNEETRIFCKHGLEHFLDVARIAYIINLEENLGYSKEIIYVTSLLHDIGKFLQYEEKIPHEISSWNLSEKLLDKYDFTLEEIELIKEGIIGHRQKESKNFAKLLYKADKLSRLCFTCPAEKQCNWDFEKKNFNINY